jgi:uncharacterized protein YfiM (DUF2279 family)
LLNFKLSAYASLIILALPGIPFWSASAYAQDSTRQEVIVHLQTSVRPVPILHNADLWYGDDKIRHVLGSFISTTLLTQVGNHSLEWKNQDTKIFAAGTTMSLGFVKELYDRRRPGNHFCWKDLAADAAGVILGLVISGIK